MDQDERKDKSFTVNLSYASALWLPTQEHIGEVSVRCVMSIQSKKTQLDLATVLGPLPQELTETLLTGLYGGSHTNRKSFRAALHSAIETHMGREVGPVRDDRIDWGVDQP